MADYDKAIRIDPKFAEAYSSRANAKQDLGDLNGSISDYETAIRINPLFAKAYANRGLARLFKGDLVGAEKDFDHCLKLEPELKSVLDDQIVRAKQRLGARL